MVAISFFSNNELKLVTTHFYKHHLKKKSCTARHSGGSCKTTHLSLLVRNLEMHLNILDQCHVIGLPRHAIREQSFSSFLI